ncbi:uncharacterized protein LOC108205891 isoform X2 [Daucus carota subsp. sativus]|uniref:uncharacterized protein LOC108205891 isoform X2 n=1 Tax=Daucus carota subsp. sativus TaxID=79200 RepID=UPI0007F03B78|nr:PREDICTED: uncharacterized protein LOC108205891 isoform X2 [Daucus carota subsp. sativus]
METKTKRVLNHEGHPAHTLQLMHKEASFNCDACFGDAKDSSYVCTTCEFWIHKRCAFAASMIPDPSYHHHSLNLIYSIPDMHRYFQHFCYICGELVRKNSWLYYCHKCTFFVHMTCSASTDSVSTSSDFEEQGDGHECDLVEFPLPSEESVLDLILTQCGKFQVDNAIEISKSTNDPQIIEEHWSHKDHPLEKLQFSTSENENSNKNYDEVLICDGCIQPITESHPTYYACIQCDFFLHSFCATKIPLELPVGGSSFHPQHSLQLRKTDKFYNHVKCGVCWYKTNGFYYHCEPCDIKIDIRCAFLPARIKHKSHKHHSLVQRPCHSLVQNHRDHASCSSSRIRIDGGVGYACETCTNFQIHILCLFYASTIKHRYDDHPITLRYPPFFYEGVIRCDVCEEQVHNQGLLYHCGNCDQSFHYKCLRLADNVKLGRTMKLTLNNQPHTLVYVVKMSERNESPMYICGICRTSYESSFFLECEGCGLLVCRKCISKLQ